VNRITLNAFRPLSWFASNRVTASIDLIGQNTQSVHVAVGYTSYHSFGRSDVSCISALIQDLCSASETPTVA
jgi:hypothetical protein